MLLWYIYQLVGIVGYKLAAFYLNGVSYPFIRMENIQLLFIVGYVESTDSRIECHRGRRFELLRMNLLPSDILVYDPTGILAGSRTVGDLVITDFLIMACHFHKRISSNPRLILISFKLTEATSAKEKPS